MRWVGVVAGSLVAIGCGKPSEAPIDATVDDGAIDTGRPPGLVACDFPCASSYLCDGPGGWRAARTLWCGKGECANAEWTPARRCNYGAICEAYGPTTPCPDGLECKNAPLGLVDAGATPCHPPCEPWDPGGNLPPFQPPVAQDACTGAQADAFVASCVQGTQQSCNAFVTDPKNKQCLGCADALSVYAAYSAAACIAVIEGDAGSQGCAAREARADWCKRMACDHCDTTEGPALILGCLDAGLTPTCASAHAARCDLADASAARCVAGDEATRIRTWLGVVCGAGG